MRVSWAKLVKISTSGALRLPAPSWAKAVNWKIPGGRVPRSSDQPAVPSAALVWLTLALAPMSGVNTQNTSASPTLSRAVPSTVKGAPLVKVAFGGGKVIETVGGIVSTGGGVGNVKSQ